MKILHKKADLQPENTLYMIKKTSSSRLTFWEKHVAACFILLLLFFSSEDLLQPSNALRFALLGCAVVQGHLKIHTAKNNFCVELNIQTYTCRYVYKPKYNKNIKEPQCAGWLSQCDMQTTTTTTCSRS